MATNALIVKVFTLGMLLAAPAMADPAPILRPAPLPGKGVVAIVAPASRMDRGVVDRAEEQLRQRGYTVRRGQSLYGQGGLGMLAGSDEARLADLNQAIRDPEVHAIICARGGYGAPRILDGIDFQALRRHPKIIVGFSDITALHCAVLAKSGVATYHGPMLAGITGGTGGSAFSREQFWRCLTGELQPGPLPVPSGRPLVAWSQGDAEGQLIGGNLTLLANMCGTPYAANTQGRVLFIEDVTDQAYRIDRAMAQLRMAGALDKVAAVLVGEFIAKESASEVRVIEDVLKGYLLPLGIPVLANLPVGHGSHNATLPIGVRVRVTSDPPVVTLLDAATQEK